MICTSVYCWWLSYFSLLYCHVISSTWINNPSMTRVDTKKFWLKFFYLLRLKEFVQLLQLFLSEQKQALGRPLLLITSSNLKCSTSVFFLLPIWRSLIKFPASLTSMPWALTFFPPWPVRFLTISLAFFIVVPNLQELSL